MSLDSLFLMLAYYDVCRTARQNEVRITHPEALMGTKPEMPFRDDVRRALEWLPHKKTFFLLAKAMHAYLDELDFRRHTAYVDRVAQRLNLQDQLLR
jgi:hypothetical protein